MTPVVCRVKHDPEAGTYGDCLRACVATILDLDAEAVPHFFHDNCDGAQAQIRVRKYLAKLGYAPMFSNWPGEVSLTELQEFMASQNPGVVCVLFGSTVEGDHAVVCRDGKTVHNPAWFPHPIIGPNSAGWWQVMVVARS